MSINILPGTPETLRTMKGQKFVPHEGEGVVFVKLVMIRPETMEKDDPEKTVEDASGVILCGQLDEIRDQIGQWVDESAAEYRKLTKKVTSDQEPKPQPPTERW